MKLLIMTSVLDIRLPYSCTNEWWHLFMALYEQGVELKVTAYQGRTIPSPWWESYENPCYWEGRSFAAFKKWQERVLPVTSSQVGAEDSLSNRATLATVHAFIRPRWRRHLLSILERNQDADAVLFINIPPNHMLGIPTEIRERFDIPTICYDPDLPASLPGYAGFATGFRIYHDADLSEYDLFIGNSIGGAAELEKMGARKALPLIWGTDPIVFSPVPVPEQDIDVFFYGSTAEYREDWIEWMLIDASKKMPDYLFAIRGRRSGFQADLGSTEFLRNIPFNRLREFCCRSKLNLNIARGSHTSVYGSSSNRPFELAAMECCIVSNPHPGLEEWFEPGKELFIVEEPGEIPDLYQWLLTHEAERRSAGKRARERVLKEHTYQHRAKQLIHMIEELSG